MCVRQEVIGNVALCEDTTSPRLTKVERIERSVQDGAWEFWSWKFSDHVTDQLFDNVEARLWLLYCKDEMPWTSNPSTARCGAAVVDIGVDKQGVLERGPGCSEQRDIRHIAILDRRKYLECDARSAGVLVGTGAAVEGLCLDGKQGPS
jgi:hypothetical protein